jgi:hypothetical protein
MMSRATACPPVECRIAGQKLGDAFGQVQVAPMGGGKVRMAVGVVQEEEGASAQHFACTPDESAGNQIIAEDRLAVPIHVRSAGGGLPGCDAPTGQSLEVQAARASVSLSLPPERASWERNRSVCQKP